MRTLIHYSILILLSIGLLHGQWGCAHMPKLPSEEMRAQFGTIGIVSASSDPKIQFHPEFAKGRLSGVYRGTGIGAGAGALYGLCLLTPACNAPGYIPPPGSCRGNACLGILIAYGTGATIGAIVGGVVGGIKGAIYAVPKEEGQRIEATAQNAFDGIIIQKAMAASVFKNSSESPNYVFVLLEGEDFINSAPYNFNLLRERGINTLLELNVKGAGFKEGRGENPLIAFFMKVHTRLIRTMDGKEIYSREFEYKSPRYYSVDWLDDDARLLREEINNCFNELPRQIVEELFGRRSL